MFLIDTNVLSEPLRLVPHKRVAQWLEAQDVQKTFISVISESEMYFGLNVMPPGKRRTFLEEQLPLIFDGYVGSRRLDFDRQCALRYAILRAQNQQQGRVMEVHDAMLAATALAYDLTLVTRNVSDFAHCDVPLLNPWTD